MEQRAHQGVEVRRRLGVQHTRPIEAARLLVYEGLRPWERKRQAPREGLVEHHTEGVPVGRRPEGQPLGLLGGHVRPRAARAVRGVVEALVDAEGEGEAEVEQHRVAAPGDHHVAGLDVAVQPTRRVHRRQALYELREHGRQPGEAPRGETRAALVIGPQPIEQTDPFDHLHGEVRLPVLDEELVQLDEVGVRDARHRTKLLLEPEDVVGVEPPQGLERHVALHLRVARAVDHPHPTLAEGLQDAEALRPRKHRAPIVAARRNPRQALTRCAEAAPTT